jgi:hypothetical protein
MPRVSAAAWPILRSFPFSACSLPPPEPPFTAFNFITTQFHTIKVPYSDSAHLI